MKSATADRQFVTKILRFAQQFPTRIADRELLLGITELKIFVPKSAIGGC